MQLQFREELGLYGQHGFLSLSHLDIRYHKFDLQILDGSAHIFLSQNKQSHIYVGPKVETADADCKASMLFLRMLLKLPTKKLMLVGGETHITNYKRQLNKIKLYTLFIVMPNFILIQ